MEPNLPNAPERLPVGTASVYLVSYPKIIFMYPTWFASLLAGLCALWFRDIQGPHMHVVTAVFLALFTFNLIVFAFDFPRTTSLTLVFFLMAVIFGLLLLFRLKEDLLPFISNILKQYHPEANATFYFSIFTVLSLICLAVLVNVNLDYWEVTPNELLHHHGVLSNLERFAAPSLKIDKEINDLFEYALLGAGRLILHPSNERRAIVLDNVLFINKKEAKLTDMLGALQVKVVTTNS